MRKGPTQTSAAPCKSVDCMRYNMTESLRRGATCLYKEKRARCRCSHEAQVDVKVEKEVKMNDIMGTD